MHCCTRQEGNKWEGCMLGFQFTNSGPQYLQSLEEWALYIQTHLEIFVDVEGQIGTSTLESVGCRVVRRLLMG